MLKVVRKAYLLVTAGVHGVQVVLGPSSYNPTLGNLGLSPSAPGSSRGRLNLGQKSEELTSTGVAARTPRWGLPMPPIRPPRSR